MVETLMFSLNKVILIEHFYKRDSEESPKYLCNLSQTLNRTGFITAIKCEVTHNKTQSKFFSCN